MARISTKWNPLEAGTTSSSGARLNFYEQSLVGALRRRNRVRVLQYEVAFQITLIERLQEMIRAMEDLPPEMSVLDIIFHIRITVIAFAPQRHKPDRPLDSLPVEVWDNKTVFPTWTSKLSEIMKSVQEIFLDRRPADRTAEALNEEILRNIREAQALVDMFEAELVELREIQEIQDGARKPFISILERRKESQAARAAAAYGPVAGPEVNPATVRINPRIFRNSVDYSEPIYDTSGVSLFEPSSDADESENSDDSLSDDEPLTLKEIFSRQRRDRLLRQPLPLLLSARRPNAAEPGPRRQTFREMMQAAEWERERIMTGEPPKETNMNPKPDDSWTVQKRGALYYPTYCGHRFSLYAHVALTLAQVKDDCYDECQRIITDNSKLTDTTEAEEVILVEALGMIVNKRDPAVIQQFVHHATLLRHAREISKDEIPQLFENMPDLNSGIRRRFDLIATDTYETLRDIATRFKDELVTEFDESAVPLTDQPWTEQDAVIPRRLPMDLGLDLGINLSGERDNAEDRNKAGGHRGHNGEQSGEGSSSRQEKEEAGKCHDKDGAEGSVDRDKGKGKETTGDGDGDKERDDKEDKGKARAIEEDADDEKEEGSDDEDDEAEDDEDSDDVLIDPKGKGKLVERIDYKGKGKAVDPVDYKGKGKAVDTIDNKGKGRAIGLSEDENEDREDEDQDQELDKEPAIAKIIGNVGELDIKGKGRAVVPSRPDEIPSAESGRASGNLTDRRPGRWVGQVVQIYPKHHGQVLLFPVPPSSSTDPATQWARNFFESVPFELQDAVATGSLHRINRELSLYGVRDAIDYVSLLQEAGCIDYRETNLDIASVSRRRS